MMMVFLNSGQEKHIIKVVEVVTITGFCCIDSQSQPSAAACFSKASIQIGQAQRSG